MSILLPNSIFIHIPKTGGSWVTEALTNCGLMTGEEINYTSLKHEPAENVQHYHKPCFTFIRNPLTWYQSRWSSPYHRSRYFRNDTYHELDAITRKQLYNFQAWLTYVFKTTPTRKSIVGRFYTAQYQNTKNIIFGRYENLTEDLIRILKSLGESFDEKCIRNLSSVNERVTNNRYYTKNLLFEAIEREQVTMNKFGYSTNWRDYQHLLER